MKHWITEYENLADDGAPYAGPVLLAETQQAAETLIAFVRGPNGEPLTLLGELVKRVPAEVIGDTYTIVRPPTS
jgi:hypothetical protein